MSTSTVHIVTNKNSWNWFEFIYEYIYSTCTSTFTSMYVYKYPFSTINQVSISCSSYMYIQSVKSLGPLF